MTSAAQSGGSVPLKIRRLILSMSIESLDAVLVDVVDLLAYRRCTVPRNGNI